MKLHSKMFRKVAIYKCTCVCKCLSLSIYFQPYNSFPPVSIYCAYYLFMYVQFSCCPLRALNWSINWIELNWIELKIHVQAIKYSVKFYFKPNLDIVMLSCQNAVQCLMGSFYTWWPPSHWLHHHGSQSACLVIFGGTVDTQFIPLL